MATQLANCFRQNRWRILTILDQESCWEVIGPVTSDGHPIFKFNETSTTARKIVYCFAFGRKWKRGHRYILRDHCENCLCVRPSHVYRESLKSFHNEENKNGKKNLTSFKRTHLKIDRQAAMMIRFSKEPARVLAKRFNISVSGVYAIKSRRYWK